MNSPVLLEESDHPDHIAEELVAVRGEEPVVLGEGALDLRGGGGDGEDHPDQLGEEREEGLVLLPRAQRVLLEDPCAVWSLRRFGKDLRIIYGEARNNFESCLHWSLYQIGSIMGGHYLKSKHDCESNGIFFIFMG